jgi:uncharacterized repeat protein (TIGR04138 family)
MPSFEEAVELIRSNDPRYAAQAYAFVRDALDYTVRRLEKPLFGPERNVTGRELLDGIRQYALQEFGPLTLRVLHEWGLTRSEDFGEIVFNMVELGVLGKTPNDRKDDFSGGYDFDTAFAAPFRPSSTPSQSRTHHA